MKAISLSSTICYIHSSRLAGQECHHNESYFGSLDGIQRIAKLTIYAAEVLRTLSSRHRIYTVYFAILL